MILVGTKQDLRDDPSTKNIVTYSEGLGLQTKLKMAKYFECSAKQQTGIKPIFEEACRLSLNPETSKNRKIKKKCLLL